MIMSRLFANKSSYPKENAQGNLCGRTHYVDDATLRWHKSRIIASGHTDNGLLFWLISSDALDMHNTKRGFRYVIFDIFGTVVDRPTLEQAFRTSAQARKAMWNSLNLIEAKNHTFDAIEAAERNFADEMSRLREEVSAL